MGPFADITNMRLFRNVGGTLVIAFVFSFALACGRPSQSGSSVIRIEIPKNQKLEAMAALPSGAKICFGVSVTGDGILGRAATSCSPSTGLLVGYAESGKPIEATVDYGNNRKVDVFMIVMKTLTDPCPAIGSGFLKTDLNRIFLVGSSAPFTVSTPETQVDVQLNYTGVPLGANFPISCFLGDRISASNPNGFFFGLASGTVVDTNNEVRLRARVGHASAELRAGNIILKVK